jgi:hypothetical protein
VQFVDNIRDEVVHSGSLGAPQTQYCISGKRIVFLWLLYEHLMHRPLKMLKAGVCIGSVLPLSAPPSRCKERFHLEWLNSSCKALPEHLFFVSLSHDDNNERVEPCAVRNRTGQGAQRALG